jgi:hypothetical protein
VGVNADEQGAGYARALTVQAYSLADCQDMRLVERPIECRPAVTRCAERNPLRRNPWVWRDGEISSHQARNVRKEGRWRRLAGKRTSMI